jgi:peptidoglycan-associated lipoprotein
MNASPFEQNVSKNLRIALVLLLVGVFAGCSPKGAESTESTMPDQSLTQDDSDQEPLSAAWDNSGQGENGPCNLNSVYFGFDRHELDTQARANLNANAECIIQRRPASVGITGMADPRGTTEYNLALGDRRARAAMQYVANQGVEQNILHPRSVGEEMATGSDEGTYANDRRADFNMQ